jgi:hypothetical protein
VRTQPRQPDSHTLYTKHAIITASQSPPAQCDRTCPPCTLHHSQKLTSVGTSQAQNRTRPALLVQPTSSALQHVDTPAYSRSVNKALYAQTPHKPKIHTRTHDASLHTSQLHTLREHMLSCQTDPFLPMGTVQPQHGRKNPHNAGCSPHTPPNVHHTYQSTHKSLLNPLNPRKTPTHMLAPLHPLTQGLHWVHSVHRGAA